MKGTENEETNAENSPLKIEKLSKQARNRFYAQTSRARHRLYVANLEKEREALLSRLTKLEEENSKMRAELTELRNISTVTNINDSNNNAFMSTNSNSSSYLSLSNSHSQLQQNTYALSVLDFTRSSLGPNSLDSPLNERLLLAFASALLVSENGQRPAQMNWKSKFCCQQEEEKTKMILMMRVKKLILLIRNSFHLKNSKVLQLRLINLLRIYLQQSIK